MHNICLTVRRVGEDLLTETVGWVVIVTTVAALLTLGVLASAFGWPSTFGYSLLGLLAAGGAVGFITFLLRRDERYGLLLPTKTLDFLGVLSYFMVALPLGVGLGAFLEVVIG